MNLKLKSDVNATDTFPRFNITDYDKCFLRTFLSELAELVMTAAAVPLAFDSVVTEGDGDVMVTVPMVTELADGSVGSDFTIGDWKLSKVR